MKEDNASYMKNIKLIKRFAESQYKTHKNLSHRINLWSYGTNKESWHKWIFNKIQLQENERLLELGCGTGKLWVENFNDIPATCKIIISDFSKNMLKKAKKNLRPFNLPIRYEKINAEDIPYAEQTFDVVIGCHILYHIPNIEKALKSICSVLKPNGRFISTTVSFQHMQELKDFLSDFGLTFEKKVKFFSEFRNETGKDILNRYFKDIDFYEYINQVNISFIEPLKEYINSMFPNKQYPHFKEMESQIDNAIRKILEEKSQFKITGISGLFKATEKSAKF